MIIQKQGLIESRGLDATTLTEIEELARICNQHEGLDLKINLNVLHKRPEDQLSDFLYYADEQLVGFLPLFSFNGQEGELCGMVHPEYRRRGIFRTLFNAACQEARRRKLPSLLLIAEQASPAGQAFIRQYATTYDHSEYKMILTEFHAPENFKEDLLFRPATVYDLPAMSTITAEAFGIPGEEVDWYTPESLTQPDHRYYIGEMNGTVIGKIDVHHAKDSSSILGFAVVAEQRGKGYGRHILARTVQEIIKGGQQNIWLEVVTENKNALSLYQSVGFQETGSYDYSRLSLSN
ncbi:GNAT family N-acetyltransferase [Dictyobacter sp. S3.2.2.5]|uniref:GNAT family N-acetyltransferase n=1 Tax=Dictyobacter halimunensis TaxID=3026934 RepID=A0ABQ6FMY5_9CHLR|nr:GNAT family N-acetyltransferase [Dictyobacter sp. S3.2.2.5]